MALIHRSASSLGIPNPPWMNKAGKILRFLLPLLLIAVGVYVFYNFPALKDRLFYKIHKPKVGDIALLPSTLDSGYSQIPVGQRDQCGHNIHFDSEGNPVRICDEYIYIPKIHVAAPIVNPATPDDATINDFLLRGVVHYPGTAQPGQKGNVFLTGHSSFYWWSKSEFKTVFSLEPELQAGDRIIVYHKGIRYTYEVMEAFTVSPTTVSVLRPTHTPILTLSTCVPVGTANSRRIIRAKQISPDPATARPSSANQVTPGRLPGVR